MKCLSRIEMQEYIDNEMAPAVEAEVIKHLETCKICVSLYKQTAEDKDIINRLLNESGATSFEASIPKFMPLTEKREKRIYFRLIPVIAAASIIAFIFLFHRERTPITEKIPEAEMLMYEFYDGKDLNKLWHEKTQLQIIHDEKGNVIQSIITH